MMDDEQKIVYREEIFRKKVFVPVTYENLLYLSTKSILKNFLAIERVTGFYMSCFDT